MSEFSEMRVSLQVIAFNVDPWINIMLNNAACFVDKIYIAYPPRPWGYSLKARNSIVNSTKLEDIQVSGLPCKVEIVKGDWLDEEETRNCLLNKAREEDYDWMIIQDADEFYTSASWNRLLERLSSLRDYEAAVTPWYNFWKSPEYVIENRGSGIKCLNAGFAIKAKDSTCQFRSARKVDAKKFVCIDEPCYHYGYVMNSVAMQRKLMSFAHTNDIKNVALWYELKWLRWSEETRYLHPSSPAHWTKAIRFPLEQPDFADQIFNAFESYQTFEKGLIWKIRDHIWNCEAEIKWQEKKLRRLSRVSLNNLLSKS